VNGQGITVDQPRLIEINWDLKIFSNEKLTESEYRD